MHTLFYSPGSCSLAPHIILEEIGAPYEEVLISTKDGHQHTPEYKKINPRGRVPALRVGDNILTECAAILLFLAQSNPEKKLLPNDPWDLSRAVSWMSFFTSSVHAGAAAGAFRPERFTDDEAARPGVVERSKRTFLGHMSEIDAELQTKTYMLGDSFSAVDAYTFVFFRWGNRMKLDMKGLFPAYTRFTLMLLERPAVQRVAAREGISIWE